MSADLVRFYSQLPSDELSMPRDPRRPVPFVLSRLSKYLLLLFLLLAAQPAMTMAEALPDSVRAQIDRLEDAISGSTNPDSIRLELARVHRESGTLDGRLRAIDLLESIRLSYDKDRGYLLELAQTYLLSGRRADAQEVLLRLAELDPTSVGTRVSIVWLLIRGMFRYADLHGFELAARLTDEAEAIRPDDRNTLYVKSILLYLSRRDGKKVEYKSRLGRGVAELILASRPEDASTLLLCAVHCLDLGQFEDADSRFKRAIGLLPPDDARALLVPRALSGKAAYRSTDSDQKRVIHEYWEEYDPTPLTLVNETLLRYWYNMAIADLTYGDPDREIRGWATPPGRAIAVYGPPRRATYHQGSFSGASATVKRTRDLSFYKEVHYFIPPKIEMLYPGGLILQFSDVTLQGDWVADDATASILEGAIKQGPPIVAPQLPGGLSRLFVSHASFRLDEGKSREGCIVCVPPWNRGGDWWEGAVVGLTIFDSQARSVANLQHLVGEGDLYEFEHDRQALLFGSDFALPAGRYTLLVEMDRGDGRSTGSRRIPLTVESFEGEALQLSDIEPVVPGSLREPGPVLLRPARPYLPDPTGTTDSEGKIDVAYTVYNLGRDDQGSAWYEVEYLVVPLKYRRAHAKLLSSGADGLEDSLRYGREGDHLGEVTLTDRNRRLTRFLPAEVKNLRTGAAVPKLARIDVAGMPEGFYALRITLTDVVTGQSARAELPFRKISDLEREAMLRAGS